MAKIKSYTDISQSKKLAEILPLESADMWYHGHGSPWESERKYDSDAYSFHSMKPNWDKPCWSLAALLGVLPKGYSLGRRRNGNYYVCMTYINHLISNFDNPVDACVAMIERLNELNLL